MKCLNTSLPLVQQALSFIKSEPLTAKVIEMSGADPSMDDVIRNYYQLAEPLTSQANKELDDYLLNFLKPFGVKSEEFESLKERLGIDALGATDVLNKLIWYRKDRRKDTIPEEAAHMIVMLMGEGNPDINDLLSEITMWPGYKEVYDKYMPIYKNEKQVKIEAIGKLISQALVENFDKSGLDASLLNKLLQAIKNFFKQLDAFMSKHSGGNFTSRYLADKIAINVLSGNKNYVSAIKNNREQLDYEKAVSDNPLAKRIIDTFTKGRFNFKLVGSLAIAGQGEKIYRPSAEPIHDLDFVVEGIKNYNDLVNYLDQMKAVPVHYGWKSTDYTTYAYYIPAQGYRVKVLSRKTGGYATEVEVTDKATGKVVPMTSKNVISTDFFVYYNKSNNTNRGIFKSWQDIYKGKLMLSPQKNEERMFQRTKDQEDYILSTPNDMRVSLPEFMYYQTEEETKELDNKTKNFLDKIGVSVEKVNQIRDAQGNPLSAIAKADMLNRVIEVIEGKADLTTLPEEAAHFFVEMLDESNPLMKQMLEKITGYEIYRQTVEMYKNRPEYRLPGGGINFPKLKKEAIGKLIAQHIVRQDAGAETQERLNFLMGWFQKLWDFVSKAFNKVDENPFEMAANKILNADTEGLDMNLNSKEVYFQLDDSVNKLENEQKNLTLDNSVDPRTGQKRHIYYRLGKAVAGNVTTLKVDPFYRKLFPNDRRSERQKEIDLEKAQYGDMIHATMEDILDTYIDPVTRKRRPQPVASRSKYVGTDFYNTLDAYVRDLINSYDPNTRFIKEVKVYDSVQDMAGSIDLLAIEPDGTVNVYDWKSQEIGRDKTELPPYKEKAYRIQLQEYMNILKKEYSFNKFGKMRAIPIKTKFAYTGQVGLKELTGLDSVEIGPVDSKFTDPEKDYLLPVTLKEEKNEDENMGELIDKLNSLLERFESKKTKGTDKLAMREKISRYRKAIRDLSLRKDIRKFTELGTFEVNRYRKKIDEGTLTEKDALESLDILSMFADTTDSFRNYMQDIRAAMAQEQNPYFKSLYEKIISDYNSLNSNANLVAKDMQRAIKKLGEQIAYEKGGIQNLLKSELKVGNMAGMFNALSQIPQRAFKAFYRILSNAQGKRDATFREYTEKLSEVKKDVEAWAKSKGLSGERIFDMILDFDAKGQWTGNFVRKVKKEFYSERNNAISKGDINWMQKNTTFDQEWYEKDLKNYMEYVSTQTYDMDTQINQALQTRIVNNWIADHNVTANNQAWLNPRNKYIKTQTQWETDQWKNLHKAENAPMLKLYTEFQQLLRKSEKLGMLDEYSPEFIPSMYKSKIDQVVFGGRVFSGTGLFEGLEVGTDDNYTPEIDPITGKLVMNIPVHFTKDIGVDNEDGTIDYSKKSRDLFKVFNIWSAQMAAYEAMSEIEDAANILVHVEQGKDQLVSDRWNNPIIERGVPKEAKGNERNAKLLENFVNFYLYNKMSDNTTDKKFTFRDKEYSLNKTGRWFMSFFSLKTLALNPISGTANFVGGTGNALFTAAKKNVFTTKDWASSVYQISKRDPKTLALLHFTDILMEDRKSAEAEKMSVSSIVKFNTMDKMYTFQRASDKAVQYPVAIATMMNHMVDANGKIVDITKEVKKEFNYDQVFYNLSAAERDAMKKKIDDRVKELKEKQSIYATTKVVNDKLDIPGVDMKSEEWFRFKAKIKQVNKSVLGNSTRDDINAIRTTQIGMMFMQFRAWMPQMVKERFGKLDYNQDLDLYTMGKSRLFFTEMFRRPFAMAQAIVKSTGTNVIEAAKQRYIMERAKAVEEGRDFELTEAEFIDMYIGNIRSQLREMATLIGVLALIFMAKPGDDDDEDEKGIRKYIGRALNKYYAEFSFYYLPTSFTELVKSPLPIVGLATDFMSLVKASTKELYGTAVDDEDLTDDAKPMKYVGRMLPIIKEGLQMRAIFDDDFRREWDIRIQ